MYTLFALSEYIVVLSNIFFHLQTVYDMKQTQAFIIEKSANYSLLEKMDFGDRIRLV